MTGVQTCALPIFPVFLLLYIIGKNQETIKITNTTTIEAGLITNKYEGFWNSIKVKILTSDGELATKKLSELTKKPSELTITLDNVSANPYATILQFFTTRETAKFIKTELDQYDLKVLDQIRDVVLHKRGNETLILTGNQMGEAQNGSSNLAKFIDDLIDSQSNKLGGMLLKTYDSDIFNNWVQTDWIDGAGGITEITSIDSLS